MLPVFVNEDVSLFCVRRDECRSVKFVGPKILAGLNDRYAAYMRGGGAPESSPSSSGRGMKSLGDKNKDTGSSAAVPKKRGRPKKGIATVVADEADEGDAEEGAFSGVPHGSVIPIPRAVPSAGPSTYPQMGWDPFARHTSDNTVPDVPLASPSSFVFWYIGSFQFHSRSFLTKNYLKIPTKDAYSIETRQRWSSSTNTTYGIQSNIPPTKPIILLSMASSTSSPHH